MPTSRIPNFYKLPIEQRIDRLADAAALAPEDELQLRQPPLDKESADKLIENVVAVYGLPFGIALNFAVNGKDHLVPMVIEEPSVVASASGAAKIVRQAGGYSAGSTERAMIGQIQVIGCSDWQRAKKAVEAASLELIERANQLQPQMRERGGGALAVEARLVGEGKGTYEQMLVVQLTINTCDAMGANTINTMVEGLAPLIEQLTGGKVYLRILSNYTDHCRAWAECRIPTASLTSGAWSGQEVAQGIVHAYHFAEQDVYRAVTHNKGVMNGIDAVVIATGNDWRAVEAASHAWAARGGRYASLTTWKLEHGHLYGRIELPLAIGTVGGATRVHPLARLALKLLDVEGAKELAQVVAAVGLNQNLAALRALVTEGIQKGHMALHARSVALSAGAQGDQVEQVAQRLVELNDIKLERALQLLHSEDWNGVSR